MGRRGGDTTGHGWQHLRIAYAAPRHLQSRSWSAAAVPSLAALMVAALRTDGYGSAVPPRQQQRIRAMVAPGWQQRLRDTAAAPRPSSTSAVARSPSTSATCSGSAAVASLRLDLLVAPQRTQRLPDRGVRRWQEPGRGSRRVLGRGGRRPCAGERSRHALGTGCTREQSPVVVSVDAGGAGAPHGDLAPVGKMQGLMRPRVGVAPRWRGRPDGPTWREDAVSGARVGGEELRRPPPCFSSATTMEVGGGAARWGTSGGASR